MGRTRLLCGQGLGVTVVVLPFDWCLVSEFRVESPAVVPGFDPVADRQAGFGSGFEHSPIDEFFLQRGQERFGGSVVPTHSGAAHRLVHSVMVAEFGVLV